ncbi:MAG: glycosyltransferase family 4 protein [Acidimicrobiales bacterium]
MAWWRPSGGPRVTRPASRREGRVRQYCGAGRAGDACSHPCGQHAEADLFVGTGIDVRLTPIASKWDVGGLRGLADVLRGADVVHAHDRRAALFALPLARLRKSAALYTYHGLPEDFAPLVGRPDDLGIGSIPWKRRVWVLRCLLQVEGRLGRLGAVVVPSQALADFLTAHGFPCRLVHVIPYGIDLDLDLDLAFDRHRGDQFTVGTAAILVPRKNIGLTIEACARAATPLRLEVFGDGPCRRSLEMQARRLGVDATFHGLIPDVRSRFADLDAFVLSTNGDNLPVAILEAMAAGLPVVATRTGGIPELVIDGVSGALVEPGDIEGFVAALDSLASDDERRRALGAAGRDRARRCFDADDVAKRLIALYRSLCASSTESRN